LVAVLLFSIGLHPTVSAQSTDENNQEGFEAGVSTLMLEAATAYVNPAVSGFGMNLNSGWYHRAPSASLFGFDLEFGLVGMATVFDDANTTFSVTGSIRFDEDQATALANQSNAPVIYRDDVRDAILSQEFRVDFFGPTVVGRESDSLTISFPGKQIPVTTSTGTFMYDIPAFVFSEEGGGTDLKAFPLAAPQISFGTILGTQFSIRILPEFQTEKLGKIKYVGFGIQHNPFSWLPVDLPMDVGLGYFTQTLTIGSLMESKASTFGITGSIRLGWGFLNLTPYAGFMIESSSTDFAYDYVFKTAAGEETVPIAFTLEGENASRFTLGLAVKILLVNVNLDINMGKFRAYSAGVMIAI